MEGKLFIYKVLLPPDRQTHPYLLRLLPIGVLCRTDWSIDQTWTPLPFKASVVLVQSFLRLSSLHNHHCRLFIFLSFSCVHLFPARKGLCVSQLNLFYPLRHISWWVLACFLLMKKRCSGSFLLAKEKAKMFGQKDAKQRGNTKRKKDHIETMVWGHL